MLARFNRLENPPRAALPAPVRPRTAVRTLAVVIPAHDEQALVANCLQSLQVAARCPRLEGAEVILIVALDSCRDRTGEIARSLGALTVDMSARNVGAARAAGAALALSRQAEWLAFTDADTRVSPDWLSAQLALRCDVVCGTVAVAGWGGYGERMRQHYRALYNDADGHRHIHGANLGVCAAAYRRAGGFEPLVRNEDVALVHTLQAQGASIAWSARPRVVTSARKAFKAPGGFGATLRRMDEALALMGEAA